jgi:hypothetical protein
MGLFAGQPSIGLGSKRVAQKRLSSIGHHQTTLTLLAKDLTLEPLQLVAQGSNFGTLIVDQFR